MPLVLNGGAHLERPFRAGAALGSSSGPIASRYVFIAIIACRVPVRPSSDSQNGTDGMGVETFSAPPRSVR